MANYLENSRRNSNKSWHNSTICSLNGHNEVWDSRKVHETIVVRMIDANNNVQDDVKEIYHEDRPMSKIQAHEVPELSPTQTRNAFSSDSITSRSQTLCEKLDARRPTSRQTTIYRVEKAKLKKARATEGDPAEKEDSPRSRKLRLNSPAIIQTGQQNIFSHSYYDDDYEPRERCGGERKTHKHEDDDNGQIDDDIIRRFIRTSKNLADELRSLKSWILDENILRIYIEPVK